MSKISRYLQEHLEGEVMSGLDARRYFSTDSSVLKIMPTAVVYPRSDEDVRKICRFAWQLAEKGHKLPITARGSGMDTSGAAIGSGIVTVFGPHLNRILALNSRQRLVSVEPGIKAGSLQQALYTHNQFLPSLSPDDSSATLGGLIANNASGAKTIKYGSIGSSLEKLNVVLANGEMILVAPLDKRALNEKMGLSTFEGLVYRELDALLEDNQDTIALAKEKLGRLSDNVAGFNIFDIIQNGTFNLAHLLAGSQGTLGIVTGAVLKLEEYNPQVSLALISLGRLSSLNKLLPEIIKLGPSACDMLSRDALELVAQTLPGYLDGELDRTQAAVHLLVEFDDIKSNIRDNKLSTLQKLVEIVGGEYVLASTVSEQDNLRRLFAAPKALGLGSVSHMSSVPAADVAVPPENLADLIEKLQKVHDQSATAAVITGHAAAGMVSIRPNLNLAETGDRQKLFKLTAAAYDEAIAVGGTMSAGSGDGRLRGNRLEKLYGKKVFGLMQEVKKIFDPHGILNPGVKFGTSERDVKMMLNSNYQPHHKYSSPGL